MKDPYVIIGLGIIGATIAREIRRQGLGDVIVLEKELYFGEHASGRNSGVIHSGINQDPEKKKLKADMCVEGSRMLREYCKTKGVPFNECGTLVIARNKKDEQTLDTLLEWGNAVGVPSLRIIGKEELKEREPLVSDKASHALLSPTGAVVDSGKLLGAVANEAGELGVSYNFNTEVKEIREREVITNNGGFSAGHIINCAGLYADKIAHMMGVRPDLHVIPFRGEYHKIKDSSINSMIYQAPDLDFPFLDVHLTRSHDGEVLAGPNAMLSFGRESYHKEFNFSETKEMFKTVNFWRLVTSKKFLGLAFSNGKTSLFKRYFLKEIQKIYPHVEGKNIIPYRSGIRAQMVGENGEMLDDMLVVGMRNSTHILNVVSPGMTSSLAFAKYIVDGLPRIN